MLCTLNIGIIATESPETGFRDSKSIILSGQWDVAQVAVVVLALNSFRKRMRAQTERGFAVAKIKRAGKVFLFLWQS